MPKKLKSNPTNCDCIVLTLQRYLPLNYFRKKSPIIDVWHCSKYSPALRITCCLAFRIDVIFEFTCGTNLEPWQDEFFTWLSAPFALISNWNGLRNRRLMHFPKKILRDCFCIDSFTISLSQTFQSINCSLNFKSYLKY